MKLKAGGGADKSLSSSDGKSFWIPSVSTHAMVDPSVTVRNPNVIIPNEKVRLLFGACFL